MSHAASWCCSVWLMCVGGAALSTRVAWRCQWHARLMLPWRTCGKGDTGSLRMVRFARARDG